MKIIVPLAIAAVMTTAALARQNAPASSLTPGTLEEHVARAKTAAGDLYQNLFNFLCAVPGARGAGGGPRAGGPGGGRAAWYAEPVKVFDNLYFVGQSDMAARSSFRIATRRASSCPRRTGT